MAHCVIGIVNFFVKRSLCNSLCAIGIRDAENFKKGYMAHAVPLVVVANLFIKSSNISVCAMSRLSLVSFRFLLTAVQLGLSQNDVTSRCVMWLFSSFLHLAFKFGDVTCRRVMWLKPAACSHRVYCVVLFFRIFFNIFVIKCIYKSLHIKNRCMTPEFHWG